MLDMAKNPVSRCETCNILSDAKHNACKILSRREWPLRKHLILARHDQNVREIDPGGTYANQDLPFSRNQIIDLVDFQRRGIAVLNDLICAHLAIPGR